MSSTTNDTAVNLGVLCGPCSAPPDLRVLESCTRLDTLAIRESDVILSLDWVDLAGTLKAALGDAPGAKIIQVSLDHLLHN